MNLFSIVPNRVFKGSLPYPGLAVSRSLGDSVAQTLGVTCLPFVTRRAWLPDDVALIMATDGLWEGITDQESAQLVQRFDHDIDRSIYALLYLGLKRLDELELCDNITILLIRPERIQLPSG